MGWSAMWCKRREEDVFENRRKIISCMRDRPACPRLWELYGVVCCSKTKRIRSSGFAIKE